MNTNIASLFISYSNQDSELADRFAMDIARIGVNIMYDTSLLKPGDAVRETLLKSLREADIIFVILTPQSITSINVMNELGIAQEIVRNSNGRKFLLLLICGDVRLPYNISDLRAVYMKDAELDDKNYKSALDKIIITIQEFLNKTKNIDTKSNIQDNEQENGRADQRQQSKNQNPNFWLLRLNPNTWYIDDFKKDDYAFFNTYYFGKKRPEYEFFKEVKIGDLVLGFATGDYQSIVCIMEVKKPVGPDTAQGEGFEMIIKKIIKPTIPLKRIEKLIADILPKLSQNKKPPELFFKLFKVSYKEILTLENDPVGKYENVYQPYYLTEGNHQKTQDQLDFENDINSFATVIALRKVDPP